VETDWNPRRCRGGGDRARVRLGLCSGPGGLCQCPGEFVSGDDCWVAACAEWGGAVAGETTTTIPLGSSPQGVAVDPSTDMVYVANSSSYTVSVIDGATNTVTATIDVGSDPIGVAVDSSTDTVYAANANSDTVSAIAHSTTVTWTASSSAIAPTCEVLGASSSSGPWTEVTTAPCSSGSVTVDSRYHAQALKAARWFERVRDLEKAHGLYPGSLDARLDCEAGMASRLQFDRLLLEDPTFIEDSRRKNQERLLFEEAHRVVALEAERVERERRAMVAKAEILAHAPGEDAHPADVMRWALPALLAFSGGNMPAVQQIVSSVGEEYMADIRWVRDKVGSHRLDDQEFLDYLLQRAQHARDRMDLLHRVIHNRYPQRLNELRQRGLKTAGELAVREEAKALIRNDPELAARWERQDAEDAKRKARKRDKKARQARRMQVWREEWARVLGIPVEKIPAQMSRPTHKGVQQMLAHRPGWARVE